MRAPWIEYVVPLWSQNDQDSVEFTDDRQTIRPFADISIVDGKDQQEAGQQLDARVQGASFGSRRAARTIPRRSPAAGRGSAAGRGQYAPATGRANHP